MVVLGTASLSGRAACQTAVPPDSSGVAVADSTEKPRLTLPAVEVIGTSYERPSKSQSAASQGAITRDQIAARVLLRAGDVLEAVPGVLISQHSGEGKANQYYLRGFNLDHGTDIALTLAGVPVNMPSHAHGQGYADLNFSIPELLSAVEYRKGTYFAEEGDFSAAGAAHLSYVNSLDRPIAQITPGAEGYRRGIFAASPSVGHGRLLGALELLHNDGPWDHPDDYQKVNGILRYSRGTPQSGYSISAIGYSGTWNSTDQVAERAVENGTIDRFGSLDPTDGGRTGRYSLSGEFQQLSSRTLTKASAYLLHYRLNLYSNFTYFLDDSVNGDQFEQADRRVVAGFRLAHKVQSKWLGRDVQSSIGLQVRNDNVYQLGLYHTVARQRLSATRVDHVVQTSASPYAQTEWSLASKVGVLGGLRTDVYRFRVHSDEDANSGATSASLLSPKVGLALGPWAKTELFANWGEGFHSNDARGATITRDPSSGEPVGRVTPLVRASGREIGVRTSAIPRTEASLALWGLDIASELVFVGDAGTTEPSRPSRRTGVECSATYQPTKSLTLDADLAYSRARFTDTSPDGDRIPGAVEGVVSGGAGYRSPAGIFGSIRVRYFGPRPLIEDNSVRSKSSTILNAQTGCRLTGRWNVALQVFNLADARISDVDYYYTSRLKGEPSGGVDDVHTHPQEPRAFRLALGTSP